MEDKSLDFETLGREEVLAQMHQLGFEASTRRSTSELKITLRNLTKMHHPIHDYMSQLTQEEVQNVY